MDKEPIFRSTMTVNLVDSMGSDESILHAMMVSTMGAESMQINETLGRINFLMANRHGTPFEHASMTFLIEAPIFVFREFHRHRIGWSYNEMSGRYKELEPIFYIPDADRALVQIGKPGAYTFTKGDDEQIVETRVRMKESYAREYYTYLDLLEQNVAKEVARMVLPVGIYSAMFATCNPRSLMAFLSLRTKHEGSKFPSYPQREIEMVAEKMEQVFGEKFPTTYSAFCENGRVAP